MPEPLRLPDELQILHGERIDEVSPDAKSFYEPEEEARVIDGVKVQTFSYGIPEDDGLHPVMDVTFAYDTDADCYHRFVHELGFSQDGLLATLTHGVTITADGTRTEDAPEKVPDSVVGAVEKYINLSK